MEEFAVKRQYKGEGGHYVSETYCTWDDFGEQGALVAVAPQNPVRDGPVPISRLEPRFGLSLPQASLLKGSSPPANRAVALHKLQEVRRGDRAQTGDSLGRRGE